MEKLLAILFVGFMMTACSSSSQEGDDLDPELDETTSDADVVEDTGSTEAKPDTDLSEIGELEGVDSQKSAEGSTTTDESGSAPADTASTAPSDAPTMADTSSGGGASGSYTVVRGDTLMKIAFKMTGDVNRWQEIHNLNRDKVANPNVIEVGMNLQVPQTGFVDNRSGSPYVIQKGDTLGKISTQIFGNLARWKELYEHNQVLIKDPNKIYSGFTLFYEGSPLAQGGSNVDRGTASVQETQAPPAKIAPAPAAQGDANAPAAGGEEELPMDGVETPEVQGEPAAQ